MEQVLTKQLVIGILTVPLEGFVLGLDLGTTHLTRGVEVVEPQLIAILVDAILAANLLGESALGKADR